MLGIIYGLWVGACLGLTIGAFLFRVAVRQRSYARLDVSADFDDSIPEPSTGRHVKKKLTKLLNFTAEWVRMPDYERLIWFNQTINTLWPHIGKVMYKQALAQAGPALKDVCRMVPMGILESVDIEKLELGDSPVRIGGLKVYDTQEDNLIMETPIMFGSKMIVRVSVKLRVPGTGYAIRLPVELKNLQMRTIVRITASPLTETLPCVGGVSVTLLKAPYWDAQFRIADSVDWLACPLLHEAVQYSVKRAIETLIVYPNKMDFPIMENFGISPPPVGMLEVKVCRAAGLINSDFLGKSDPYCEIYVRHERVLRTRMISNDLNPVWDQTFHFLVDDIDTQSLNIEVKDDDMGFDDDTLGAVELQLDEAECCRKPREWVPVQAQLLEANSAGIISDAKTLLRQGPGVAKKLKPQLGNKKKREAKKERKAALREENGAFGMIWLEMKYQPFVSQDKLEQINKEQEKQQREQKQENDKAIEDDGDSKEHEKYGKFGKKKDQVQTDIKSMRGVLTVNVIRGRDLEYKEANEVDPYVRLTLFDPERGGTESFRTTVQVNDATPRWNEKFDFIDIPASSYLTATIYDKASMLQSRKLLKPWQQKDDKKLGYVRIAIDEVARNKDLKDEWPLLDADKGDLILSLHWQRVILQDPSMEEEEFDWRRQQAIADRYKQRKADLQLREAANGRTNAVAPGQLQSRPVESAVQPATAYHSAPYTTGFTTNGFPAVGPHDQGVHGLSQIQETHTVSTSEMRPVISSEARPMPVKAMRPVPFSAANPEGRKVSGYIDDKGQSTIHDDSEGTFVYGPQK